MPADVLRPVAALSALIVGAALMVAAGNGHAQPRPAPRPFALVELFTSEGCSSCPPADDALAAIADDARRTGAEVYALSFHVDYWDEIGWPDPFSSPANTRRQQAYARALGGGTYTPEMVVNGAEGFVGSDRAHARRSIEAALAQPTGVAIALSVERAAEQLTARCRVTGSPPGAVVGVAWVEASREVDVRRGENAGRRLRHVNVVRAWSTLPLNADGTTTHTLTVPGGARGDEVVAWVQQGAAGRALAATRSVTAARR